MTETRRAMKQLLQSHGAVVSNAGSAAAAMEQVERFKPDLLLIDVGLPDEDGYSLIRRIRANEVAGSKIPAITVTAFARTDNRAKALATGFDQHIPNPVEPSALVSVLASLVRRE